MKRILYPRSGDKELDPALFKNPTNEYRAVPFWAWNCRLDPETLLEDVEQFRQMGMGGAHIHCRTGLDTPYLGEEFFQIVSACEKKMEAMGLRLWLYDEDRWPSGTAGGLVTREDRYRMRFLVFEPEGFEPEKTQHYMAAAKAVRGKVRTRIGTYLVVQDQDGFLQEYTLLDEICGPKPRNRDYLWAGRAWYFRTNRTKRTDMACRLEVSGVIPGLMIRHMSIHSIQRQWADFWSELMKCITGSWAGHLAAPFRQSLQMNRRQYIKKDFWNRFRRRR